MALKVEVIDLHGLNVKEAREKVLKNLDWAIKHGMEVLVINHGKGHHSSGFAVLKGEIRSLLKECPSLREHGYRVIYGEADWPITLTYDDGNTLIVYRGREKDYLGDSSQQAKHQRIYSEEGKQLRKSHKRWRK